MKTPEFKALEKVTEGLFEKIHERIKAMGFTEEQKKEIEQILEAAICAAVVKVGMEDNDECLKNAMEILNV